MRPSQVHRMAGFEPSYKPREGIPRVIFVLLAINIAAYALRFVMPAGLYEGLIHYLAVVPGRVAATDPDNLLALGHEVLTFITHAFLHADFLHIFLNCLCLAYFGTKVASRFQQASAVGTFVFLNFYIAAAVFSGIVFVLASLGENVLLVGASGALSAMIGGVMRIGFRRIVPWGGVRSPLLGLGSFWVISFSILYIALNLSVFTSLGRWVFLTDEPGTVAWEVHIAGYLFGLFFMPFFDRLAGNEARGGVL